MSEADAAPAISFQKVVKKRTRFEFGPVSLDIPQGYITAIVGPNGSGKSTLIRLALGLAVPDSGRIALMGMEASEDEQEERKQRIGYLAEASSDHENTMRASEKAKFHSYWYRNWNDRYYGDLLEQLQTNDGEFLGKMSKGTRRKFEFALAMAHSPELLILDEPSSGLDPLAWRRMIDILHRHMEHHNRTVIMTTHIIEEVKRLADYIVFMDHGTVKGMFEKDELFSSWIELYVSDEALTAAAVAAIPGQCGVEPAGVGTFRIVTGKGAEAERWIEEAGWQVVSRQMLELDEIMAALQGQTDISVEK